MSNYLKQFNILCEEKQIDLIFEAKKTGLLSYFQKSWLLEDEFETMLEFMINKVKLAFTSMYDSGKPGELKINGDPIITSFDEGTQTPGFKAVYIINDDYTKNNLLPCLLQTKRFKNLDEKYMFDLSIDPLDAQLIIKVNADSDGEYDLSKPNTKIPKFGIKHWDGNVYLNFKCKHADRDKSNINIGTIKTLVEVKDYKGLLDRFVDWFENTGKESVKNQRIK